MKEHNFEQEILLLLRSAILPPLQFLNFVRDTHVVGRTQPAAILTRENVILEKVFTHGLPDVKNSVLNNFPGSATR